MCKAREARQPRAGMEDFAADGGVIKEICDGGWDEEDLGKEQTAIGCDIFSDWPRARRHLECKR